MLKTTAQVCVPKLAVSYSQYFYNLRAGRAADDKLVKICVHILLLYNVSYCIQGEPVLSKYKSPLAKI